MSEQPSEQPLPSENPAAGDAAQPAPAAGAAPTTAAQPPRKSGWLRLQFGLQTLLLMTLLAAAGIKWYFQPLVREDVLADGAIKIRRQVRYEGEITPGAGNATTGAPGQGPAGKEPVNVGWWILMDEQDRIRIKGRFTAGVPTGRWAAFYENGQIQLETQYALGKPQGRWQEWFEGGAKRLEMNFAEGEPQGPIQRWHENGQQECQGEYDKGKRSGLWTFWHPDGKKRCEAEFTEDEPDGAWFTWDVKGKRQPLFGPGRREPIDTDVVIPDLVARVKGDDLRSRHDAAWALSQFGELSAKPLAQLLGDQDPEIRALAASSLAKMRRRASSVSADLIKALNDEDERVQAGAARALGAMGKAGADARPVLAKLIPKADDWLKPELLAADVGIAPDDANARGALLDWIAGAEAGVAQRQPMVSQLIVRHHDKFVKDTIARLDNADAKVRAGAVMTLTSLLQEHAQPALEKLKNLSQKDADTEVATLAKDAVEQLERRAQ
jgi:hypothetical protein